MKPALCLIATLALAGCAHDAGSPRPENGRDGARPATPVWPSYPPGFDPTRPGVQTGTWEDGTAWIIVVEDIEGFVPPEAKP